MNKRLLTIAVSAALVGASLPAQADGPTLFGRVHLSYDKAKDGSGRTLNAVSSNDSTIGIKGDRDLVGGFKAIYLLTSGGWMVDTGSATNGTTSGGLVNTLQDTWGGFSNKEFGTVKLGRESTPYKQLGRAIDYFSNRIGDSRSIIGKGGASFDGYTSNMVRYESPKIAGGLSINAAQGSGENQARTATNMDVTSATVRWDKGPLVAGIGYEKHQTATQTKESGMRAGIKYDFGMFDVRGFYEKMEDLAGVTGADRDSMGLGGSFKFGDARVAAEYYVTDKVATSSVDNGAKMMSIGLDYNLDKMTFVYLMYAKTKNDSGTSAFTYNSNSSDTSTGAGHANSITPTTLGATASAFSVGFRINF